MMLHGVVLVKVTIWFGAVPAMEHPPVTAKVGVPGPVDVAVGV